MKSIDRVCHALHGKGDDGLTVTQQVIVVFIVLGGVLAIVGSEPELPDAARDWTEALEFVVGAVFLVEYSARVWSAGARSEFAGAFGRLRYMRTPFAIIDLIAVLPFVLGVLGAESLMLRLLRVLRLLAISKMVRYSEAMRIVLASVVSRRYELMFAVLLAAFMIVLSSAALYVVEGGHQPKAFGSILRAMWWSVVTLTTVGYGDVVPITPLGKVLSGLTAIAGIGMIAMPTGILAASFSEAFARARERRASVAANQSPESNVTGSRA
jgi:voltage-gated potassium channel